MPSGFDDAEHVLQWRNNNLFDAVIGADLEVVRGPRSAPSSRSKLLVSLKVAASRGRLRVPMEIGHVANLDS